MVSREGVAYHTGRRLKGSMRENGFRAIGGLAQKLTSGIAREGGKAGRGGASTIDVVVRKKIVVSKPSVGPAMTPAEEQDATWSARGDRILFT